jgi:hypothetical protein
MGALSELHLVSTFLLKVVAAPDALETQESMYSHAEYPKLFVVAIPDDLLQGTINDLDASENPDTDEVVFVINL